jgi:tRNA pseudouridine55 synthase
VVAKVRRLTGQKKVGHAGTLDPLATGVLLVCLGNATRLLEYLVGGQKQYRAIIRFGITTDTLDAEGQILTQQDPSALSEAQIRAVLPQFIGTIQQTPPIFSAIKQDGQSIHKRARRGEEVIVMPRPVTIQSLTWVDWQPPNLTLDVVCSAGTYIRSLARDLGEAVGVGAHLGGLIRLASGQWSVEHAVTLEQLATDWQPHLISLDQVVSHLPRTDLDETNTAHVQHGRTITLDPSQIIDSPDGSPSIAAPLRAYRDGELLAILLLTDPEQNLWKPHKVFVGL